MTTTSRFQRATKRQSRLRLALAGPSGSGKTFTALAVGTALAGDGTVALVDTERGSASKYSDRFAFDVLELESFHPERYIEAIRDAEQAGYAVLILDSLSHAWMGKDGALELVDRASRRQQSGNSFGAWREVTPLHNQLVDAMLGARLHLIVTLRSKQDYVQEKDDRGRTVIRKVGMAPVQRDGLEYEFDVFGDLDHEHTLSIGKTRCSALAGQVLQKPGANLAATLAAWLSDGAPVVEPPPAPAPIPAPAPASSPNGQAKPTMAAREFSRQPEAQGLAAPKTVRQRYAEVFEKAKRENLTALPLHADPQSTDEQMIEAGKRLQAELTSIYGKPAAQGVVS